MTFDLRIWISSAKPNLETWIENKGSGRQCFLQWSMTIGRWWYGTSGNWFCIYLPGHRRKNGQGQEKKTQQTPLGTGDGRQVEARSLREEMPPDGDKMEYWEIGDKIRYWNIGILGTRWNFDDFWRLCLALEPHARCWPGCCTWCLDRPGKASWSWGPSPRWTASEAGHLGGIAVILSWRCYVMVSGWLKSSKRDNRVHSCKSRKMLACIFFTLP